MPHRTLLLPEACRRRAPSSLLLIAAAAVLGLGLGGWWALRHKHELDLRHRLEAKVQAALVEANASAKAAHDHAVGAGTEAAVPRFEAADAGADAAVNELTSFTGCFKLVWLMLRDACRRGESTHTDDHIRNVIDATVMPPYQEGCRDLTSCLGDLQDKLTGGSIRLATTLVAALEPERAELSPVLERQIAALTAATRSEAPKVRSIAIGTVCAAVGLVISAVCVRATWAAARNVFRAVAARMAAATGMALGAAAIDGPFPAGDCIAVIIEVGGTIWCICDLVKARGVLKRELSDALHRQVRESCGSALTSFRSDADAMLAAALQQNRKLADAAVAAIRQ